MKRKHKKVRRRKIMVVSVRDFGAVGDGSADDTAAFRAANRSLATIIRVPQGKYMVNSQEQLVDARFEQTE